MKAFIQTTAVLSVLMGFSLGASADIGFGEINLGQTNTPTPINTNQGSLQQNTTATTPTTTSTATPVTPAEQAAANGSFQVAMPAFNASVEYDCPLFSKTPYADVLDALNNMRKNLSSVFPACEKLDVTKSTIATAQRLQDAITAAEKYQLTGQTYKLSLSADTIVKLASSLQEGLVTMSSAKTRACYKEDRDYKNALYSINDTFQSFSPLIVGLVSNNSALAKALGPALKIFAGADAISKSLVMLEQITRASWQFDMDDGSNRVNTVRNVCQFMKLYNRLDYLRMSREGQIQTIQEKFLSDIAEKNKRVEEIRRTKIPLSIARVTKIEGAELIDSRTSSTDLQIKLDEKVDPSLDPKAADIKIDTTNVPKPDVANTAVDLFLTIEPLAASEGRRIDVAEEAFTEAKSDNIPEITQCSIIVTTLNSPSLKQFRTSYDQFATLINDTSNYRILLDSIDNYEKEIRNSMRYNDNNRCATFGADAIKKLKNLMDNASLILWNYKEKIKKSKDERFLLDSKKIKESEVDLETAQSNYINWKTMVDYIPFEASEVDKRAANLHRFMFNGPDRVESECVARAATDKPCDFKESAVGLFRMVNEKSKNHGPIYGLLKDNEDAFNANYDLMMNAIKFIQHYEDQFTLKSFGGKMPTERKAFNQFIEIREKNARELPHLSLKHLVKDTADYNNICAQAAAIKNNYVEASDHLMSTKGICDMIKPVLGLQYVSKELKDYCLPPNNATYSKIHSLLFKLVGEYDSSSSPMPSRQPYKVQFSPGLGVSQLFQVPLDSQRAPRAFFNQLLPKYYELGCTKL